MMKIYHLLIVIIFTTSICFLKGQQTTTKKNPPKFNRLFANISRECLKENRVTPERVMGVYTLGTNDREAKCYVACMLIQFNVTDGSGHYNDKALAQLIAKSSTDEVPTNMRRAIDQCEKEDDKDRCEKAVKFTKCIYAHKNEFAMRNNSSSDYRRRPTMQNGPGGRRGPWFRM